MPRTNYAHIRITLADAAPARRAARRLCSLLWLLAFPMPIGAADPPGGCANLPPALSALAVAWGVPPVQVPAGETGAAPVGRKLSLRLGPGGTCGQAIGRAGSRGVGEGRGGTLVLEVPSPGEYRVALSQRAWIELAEQSPPGRVLPATTSDKRLACAGIAKNLGFEVLSPGPHLLQITEVAADEVEILFWPASGMPAGRQ